MARNLFNIDIIKFSYGHFLGTDHRTKTDEFQEKGEGSFPNQKFMLQNLDLWIALNAHENDTKVSFEGMFLAVQ